MVAPAPTVPATLSPTDVVEDLSPQASGDKVHTYTVAKSQRLQAAAAFVKSLTDIRPDLSLELFEQINGQAQASDFMYNLYMPLGTAKTPEQIKQSLDNADTILQNVFITPSPASFGTLAIRAQAQLIKGAQSPDPAISVPMREAWNAVVNWHRNNLKNDPQILANARSILIDELAAEIPQFQDLKARQERVYLIQHLQKAMFGPDKITPEDVLMRYRPQTTAVDPNAARLSDIERRESNLREKETSEARAADMARVNFIDNAVNSSVVEEVTKYLAPWKIPSSAIPEHVYNLVQKSLLDAIGQAESASPSWKLDNDNLFSAVRQSGSDADLTALLTYRRTLAQRVLASKGPEITTPWVQTVMANNTAAHQNGSNPRPNQPAPNGPGTPAKPEGLDQVLKTTNWHDRFAAIGMG